MSCLALPRSSVQPRVAIARLDVPIDKLPLGWSVQQRPKDVRRNTPIIVGAAADIAQSQSMPLAVVPRSGDARRRHRKHRSSMRHAVTRLCHAVAPTNAVRSMRTIKPYGSRRRQHPHPEPIGVNIPTDRRPLRPHRKATASPSFAHVIKCQSPHPRPSPDGYAPSDAAPASLEMGGGDTGS
jgi:hypothetical protein